MSVTRLMTAAAMTAMGLTLSACGGASPGVAMTVGDEATTNARVAEVSDHACIGLSEQFESEGVTVPMSQIRQRMVAILAARSQATQMAEEYGISPSPGYEATVAQIRAEVAQLPEKAREDYVEVAATNTLVNDVISQIGAIVLAENGATDPAPEDAAAAGYDAYQVWSDVNGVDIDPRYGLKNVDGAIVPADTSVSAAVSDTAVAGTQEQPDPTYTAALPPQHRCG